MADPMRIRAKIKDGVTEVRVLMAHIMETGQRKDSAGAVIPAHYIKDVKATVGACMLNNGQTCNALTRLLVPADQKAEVEALLLQEFSALALSTRVDGPPLPG